MDMDYNPMLEHCLDIWMRHMSNDFGEVRKLWYPSRAAGLEPRKSVTESAWDDLEDEMEARVVSVVQTAIENLTAAQRGALERHLGLCAVVHFRNYQESLDEARGKIWRHLMSQGAV